jgi:hypothetical protein
MGLLRWLFSWESPVPAEPGGQAAALDSPEQLAAVLQRVQALQQEPADDTGKEEDFTAGTTIPVGRWLRIKLSNCPSFVGYTYVDQQAGLSAKGSSQRDPQLAIAPFMTVRLPMPRASWRVLDGEERNRLSLPLRPPWLELFGPQPEPDSLWGAWREHPKFKRRFLPDHPDDLQVLVHDGGPRITQKRPELVRQRPYGRTCRCDRGLAARLAPGPRCQLDSGADHGGLSYPGRPVVFGGGVRSVPRPLRDLASPDRRAQESRLDFPVRAGAPLVPIPGFA